MKTWEFENAVTVYERDCNGDLHCFEVYFAEKLLGTVFPDSLEIQTSMIEDLDNGEDPISGGWEDGGGESCTFDGWGYHRDNN